MPSSREGHSRRRRCIYGKRTNPNTKFGGGAEGHYKTMTMQEILDNIADEFDDFYRHAQELIDKLKEKEGGNDEQD